MHELLKENNNGVALYDAFSHYINTLMENDLWKSGSVTNKRVFWEDGKLAREQDKESFNSPGIYIWGGDHSPIYIGKTTTSFKKRFGRYIWGSKSQCNLAKKYAPLLLECGLAGFPVEIRDWYRKNHGNSLVRLNGSLRFAQEGIDKIWFALLPVKNIDEIDFLEKQLIKIAQEWNSNNERQALININFNAS